MNNATTTAKEHFIENAAKQSRSSSEVFTSTNLQNPLKKYNKLYLILAIIGAIIGFIATFTAFGSVLFAFIGVVLAWFIIQGISLVRLLKLNWIDYTLPSFVTEKQLLDYLQHNFKHPEIQIEKGLLRGISFIFKKETIHIVTLNETENTYCIHSKMSKSARLKRGGKENTAKVYMIASQIVPFIKELIDNAVVSINETESEN